MITEILLIGGIYLALTKKQPTQLNPSPTTDANINSGFGGGPGSALQVIPGNIQPSAGNTQNAPISVSDSYGGRVLIAPVGTRMVPIFDDGFGGLQGDPGSDLNIKVRPGIDGTVQNTPVAPLMVTAGTAVAIADVPPGYKLLTPDTDIPALGYPIGIEPAPITLRSDTGISYSAPDNGGGRYNVEQFIP